MNMGNKPIKVAHFVTGGFSGGATQVALALVKAQLKDPAFEPLLILRKKRRTPKARLELLRKEGIPFVVVSGWFKFATILQLQKILKKAKTDVLLAHGFSEHLWGRYAGLLAKVPTIIQVEHNTKERYNSWRLAQSRWLAKRTDGIIGCSEGVKQVLIGQGLPQEKIHAVSNGIYTEPFAVEPPPWNEREDAVVMVARFSKQKDHKTLVEAISLLREQGVHLPVYFAGGGKSIHRKPIEKLTSELGLEKQIHFLGICDDVPALLKKCKFAVLSTHYEGMPLALIEGMAAGCVAITSQVPGAQEVLSHEVTGYLVAENAPQQLALQLKQALENTDTSCRIAKHGREKALNDYSYEAMNQGYADLIKRLHAVN